MRIEVLRKPAELAPLADEWNELLARSITRVPFLRHEYVTAWWQHLGGGEWEDGELYVVIARAGDGNLVGIAPFFVTRGAGGDVMLLLIGSVEISDYLDVIVRPGDVDTFLEALLEHLDGPDAPAWNVLDLCNVLEDSPTLPALETIATARGWRYQQARLQPSPYIELPAAWDTYLEMLESRQRKELRRKLRRAANHVVPVEWYLAEQVDLDSELDSLFALMAQDPQKREFLTEKMRAQMYGIAQVASQAGWLQLAFLRVGREKAAALLSFDFNNKVWVYNSGLNMKYAELAPGMVLNGHAMQWAIEQGREGFDFMRGDEEYKYRLGAKDRYVMRATVRR